MLFRKSVFAFLFVASVCSGLVQADDIKTQIKNTTPYAYWSLENSFSSQIPSPQNITFIPKEKAGASSILYGAGFYTPDYFPLTPVHLGGAAESNGLWFGETKGDLAGVQRYLALTAAETGNQQPVSAFNMDEKKEWTLHLVVSPDPDPTNQRPEEVVFYAGNTGSDVQVLVDTKNNGTIIKLRREGQGYIDTPQLLVTELNPGERHWYQIIVRYGLRGAATVTDVTLDVASQSITQQSNQWLITPQSGPVYLGKGNTDQYFNGAIQHLALWKRNLTNNEVAALKASLNTAPQAVAPLAVDLTKPPRYFMWTVPTSEASLSNRDALNWNDPIWKVVGVYPMVRHKIDSPANAYQNPPPYSLAQSGETPQDTAKQSYAWIKYISSKLVAYTGKSLNDGIGYSLFWQDWGNHTWSGSTTAGYYNDRGAARGLMQNWRDTTSSLRNTVHATTPIAQELTEISTPFYREGMSQNAFRSALIFKELNKLIEADSTLSKPTRLHFDVEGNSNFESIGGGLGTQGQSCGWLCSALNDTRANTFELWGVKNYWGRKDNSLNSCMSLQSTLDSNGVASSNYWGNNTRTFAALLASYSSSNWVWQAQNACFREEFVRFTNANYQYALNESLKKPATQMLNNNIRVSEYEMTATGTTLDGAYYTTGRNDALLGNGKPAYLDFSSPVLYPPGHDAIDIDRDLTFSLVGWKNRLNLSYNLFGSQMSDYTNAPANEVKEAIDNLYVETQKHNLNIAVKAGQSCAPIVQSPWYPYPAYTVSNLPYTNLPVYTVKWQEVARLAVFAYRRGVRENLMWGDYEHMNAADKTNSLVGLERIFAAVNYVKANPLDMTTTGATSRSQDNFGVPDGVINQSDYDYFVARYNEQDSEADITTQSGQCSLPDGAVTTQDWNTFMSGISPYL